MSIPDVKTLLSWFPLHVPTDIHNNDGEVLPDGPGSFFCPLVVDYIEHLLGALQPLLLALPILTATQQALLSNLLRWQIEVGIEKQLRRPHLPCINVMALQQAIEAIVISQGAAALEYSAELRELAPTERGQELEAREFSFISLIQHHWWHQPPLAFVDPAPLQDTGSACLWFLFCFCRRQFELRCDYWQGVVDEEEEWSEPEEDDDRQAYEMAAMAATNQQLGQQLGNYSIFLESVLLG